MSENESASLDVSGDVENDATKKSVGDTSTTGTIKLRTNLGSPSTMVTFKKLGGGILLEGVSLSAGTFKDMYGMEIEIPKEVIARDWEKILGAGIKKSHDEGTEEVIGRNRTARLDKKNYNVITSDLIDAPRCVAYLQEHEKQIVSGEKKIGRSIEAVFSGYHDPKNKDFFHARGISSISFISLLGKDAPACGTCYNTDMKVVKFMEQNIEIKTEVPPLVEPEKDVKLQEKVKVEVPKPVTAPAPVEVKPSPVDEFVAKFAAFEKGVADNKERTDKQDEVLSTIVKLMKGMSDDVKELKTAKEISAKEDLESRLAAFKDELGTEFDKPTHWDQMPDEAKVEMIDRDADLIRMIPPKEEREVTMGAEKANNDLRKKSLSVLGEGGYDKLFPKEKEVKA